MHLAPAPTPGAGRRPIGRHRGAAAQGPRAIVTEAPLLTVNGVTKRFPGTLALVDFNFDVEAGEIQALLGENGAGKSTFIKVTARGRSLEATLSACRPGAGAARDYQPWIRRGPKSAQDLVISTEAHWLHDKGFAVLALMRRGRGRSEGINGEEDFGCDTRQPYRFSSGSLRPSRIPNRRLPMAAHCPA